MSKTTSTAAAHNAAHNAARAANAPENAGKGAAIAKSPAPASDVPDEKKTPPASPGKTLSESDRQTLRRAFHLLLAKRRSSIDGEEEMLFRDAETDKKRGTFTAESKAIYMTEYGRLTEEIFILSMLEKGVAPDSVMRSSFLTNGETKPEWKSYLSLLDDLYLMFATPEELEA